MSVFFPSTVGLHFEWGYPDPPAVEFQILRMERYFENTELFTEEAKKAMQVDMAKRFDTETDPEGIPWTPLAEPAPEQIGILQLSGQMREDALSEQAWIATPVGVFFNTSELPRYWVYHEQPEGVGSQRISQRKFIGLSDVEQARIERLADEWVAGGIVLGGVLRREARAPSGVFTRIQ